jgi:hypothetical protein
MAQRSVVKGRPNLSPTSQWRITNPHANEERQLPDLTIAMMNACETRGARRGRAAICILSQMKAAAAEGRRVAKRSGGQRVPSFGKREEGLSAQTEKNAVGGKRDAAQHSLSGATAGLPFSAVRRIIREAALFVPLFIRASLPVRVSASSQPKPALCVSSRLCTRLDHSQTACS